MSNIHAKVKRETLLPRFMIASPQGRSGKTIVSIGLCAMLRQQGLVVQPFKKGPDYIDPSWLSAAANLPCHNLDMFFMSEEALHASFQKACRHADLAVIEGAMGLYDGIDSDGRGSSARLARLLALPIILVINCARMTRSVAAMVNGYQQFEPNTNIAGVILNNVAGSRHENKLKAAIEGYCSIPVVGVVPRDTNLIITERHLGLVPFKEVHEETALIERIYHSIKTYLDINGILAVARSAQALPQTDTNDFSARLNNVRIGVMLDRVFTFYYPENLEALRQDGAELVFVDSLRDQKLPDINGLYIGGGFPELFLESLEANVNLRHEIAEAIIDGLPVYAECAGLMYLCHGIRQKGRLYQMVGIIPTEVEICTRPQGHGYTVAEVAGENPWFPVGATIKGHEFHYSKLRDIANLRFAYRMGRGHGINGHVDGIVYNNVFASYTHLHAISVPEWSGSFVSLALQHAKNRASALTC